ncbi:hypothetical protein IE53DRAFT_381794 [Violaceomyces palustris]|uniref:Uncharacterized protein n=1 Tax=Violaceomyces palustris TaxID=1673888 RepID=A0ACD0NPZ0_9BASI|nr:hypothetical protein IE53DRAFT_381794 [Violaceomyces palustris]
MGDDAVPPPPQGQGNAKPSSSNSSSGSKSFTADREDNERRQRGRVHFSCTECNRRKQKCNRQVPCQHCIARKIPDRCHIVQPGQDPDDLTVRIARLERLTNYNLELLLSVLRTQTNEGPKSDERTAAAAISARSLLEAQRSLPSDPGESPSWAAQGVESLLEGKNALQPSQVDMAARVNQLISESIRQSNGKAAEPSRLTDPTRHIGVSAPLDAVMKEYGATHSVTEMLMSSLPSPEFITHSKHLIEQPIARKLVMANYAEFWRSGPLLTVANLNTYAIIMLVAAIGSLTYNGPLKISGDAQMVRLSTKRIFYAARQSLLMSSMLGREDIEQVMGYHLACRYLMLDRRISDAWTCIVNAVKAAYTIGLHRDGSLLGLGKEECEIRRQVWSHVYFSERILSFNLGRPTGIDDRVVDTQPPSEEDSAGDFAEYMAPLSKTSLPSRLSGPQPHFLTYLGIRHRLGKIIGNLKVSHQGLQAHVDHDEIADIDKGLVALHRSLPNHLRSELDERGNLTHVDSTWDHTYEFVAVHRYLLQTEILFVRMAIHRPYLLHATPKARGKKSLRLQEKETQTYESGKRACVTSAYQTLILRRDLAEKIAARTRQGEESPAWVNHLGTFNLLAAVIVLGIHLLVEPDQEDAEMLLGALKQHYALSKQNKNQFDDSKEREFLVLSTFLERIESVRSNQRLDSDGAQRTGSKRKRQRLSSQGKDGDGDDHDDGAERKKSDALACMPASFAPTTVQASSGSTSNASNQAAKETSLETGAFSMPPSEAIEEGALFNQLFESWFRQNALDDAALNSGLGSAMDFWSSGGQNLPVAPASAEVMTSGSLWPADDAETSAVAAHLVNGERFPGSETGSSVASGEHPSYAANNT